MPAIPALQFALVDVRDVAESHVRAMEISACDGHRILVSAQPSYWFRDIGKILGHEFRSQGYYVPRFEAPNIIIWLYSFFDLDARESISRLGKPCRFDSTKVGYKILKTFLKVFIFLISKKLSKKI